MSGSEIKTETATESIRQILLNEWDPIGVREIPEARDEYDSYVDGVYRLLASNSSAQQIAEHLSKIESEQMGLAPQPVRNLLHIANHLKAALSSPRMRGGNLLKCF